MAVTQPLTNCENDGNYGCFAATARGNAKVNLGAGAAPAYSNILTHRRGGAKSKKESSCFLLCFLSFVTATPAR